MKSVLVYIFLMTLLIPSVNAQGVISNDKSVHFTMHVAQTSASDCHEKHQLTMDNNHDCCDEKSEQNISFECSNDCNNCAEDISSNNSAIISGKMSYGSPFNSKILTSRYHLPFPPHKKAFIPPIS